MRLKSSVPNADQTSQTRGIDQNRRCGWELRIKIPLVSAILSNDDQYLKGENISRLGSMALFMLYFHTNKVAAYGFDSGIAIKGGFRTRA